MKIEFSKRSAKRIVRKIPILIIKKRVYESFERRNNEFFLLLKQMIAQFTTLRRFAASASLLLICMTSNLSWLMLANFS